MRQVREGWLVVSPNSPLRIVASHVDDEGRPLSVPNAAVETSNIMRPVVAITHFIVFAAMALHEHPDWRDRFASGDDSSLDAFAEEVYRFYPFFLFIGGRVRESFEWNGYRAVERCVHHEERAVYVSDAILLATTHLDGTDHHALIFALVTLADRSGEIGCRSKGRRDLGRMIMIG